LELTSSNKSPHVGFISDVDRPAGRAKRLGRVADVLKPVPTYTRHKCRFGRVLPISFISNPFVRHYRIDTSLHRRENLSASDVW
jgi:hypothetical protein